MIRRILAVAAASLIIGSCDEPEPKPDYETLTGVGYCLSGLNHAVASGAATDGTTAVQFPWEVETLVWVDQPDRIRCAVTANGGVADVVVDIQCLQHSDPECAKLVSFEMRPEPDRLIAE